MDGTIEMLLEEEVYDALLEAIKDLVRRGRKSDIEFNERL